MTFLALRGGLALARDPVVSCRILRRTFPCVVKFFLVRCARLTSSVFAMCVLVSLMPQWHPHRCLTSLNSSRGVVEWVFPSVSERLATSSSTSVRSRRSTSLFWLGPSLDAFSVKVWLPEQLHWFCLPALFAPLSIVRRLSQPVALFLPPAATLLHAWPSQGLAYAQREARDSEQREARRHRQVQADAQLGRQPNRLGGGVSRQHGRRHVTGPCRE